MEFSVFNSLCVNVLYNLNVLYCLEEIKLERKMFPTNRQQQESIWEAGEAPAQKAST